MSSPWTYTSMPKVVDLDAELRPRRRSSGLVLDFPDAQSRETLLRGAPLHVITNPSIWQNSVSAGTIIEQEALSHNVSVLTRFLSHSWQTSPWTKYLALLFVFNARAAAMSSIVLGSLASAMFYSGLLVGPFKELQYEVLGKMVTMRLGLFPEVSGIIIFLGVLFQWHNLRRPLVWIGLLKPVHCFVDKICISQANAQLKNEGIKCLGAFMNHSEGMLVLWGQDYFTRMWCNYEVAAFARLAKDEGYTSSIEFVPEPQVQMLYGALLFSLFFIHVEMFGVWLFDWNLISVVLTFLVCVIPLICVLRAARQCSLDIRVADMQLSTFSIQNSNCREPADRAIVYEQIEEWFGSEGELPQISKTKSISSLQSTSNNTEIGLDRFNQFVRTDVKELMMEKFGLSSQLPYSMILFANLPCLLYNSVATSFAMASEGIAFWLQYLLLNFLQDAIIAPLAFWAACRVSCFCISSGERQLQADELDREKPVLMERELTVASDDQQHHGQRTGSLFSCAFRICDVVFSYFFGILAWLVVYGIFFVWPFTSLVGLSFLTFFYVLAASLAFMGRCLWCF